VVVDLLVEARREPVERDVEEIVEPTERERQSLYYEIGMTYEAIGDDSEALYYFEMVLKRDPGFADAAMRADRLRARGGRAMHSHDDDI
jgi:hypothetical protein